MKVIPYSSTPPYDRVYESMVLDFLVLNGDRESFFRFPERGHPSMQRKRRS